MSSAYILSHDQLVVLIYIFAFFVIYFLSEYSFRSTLNKFKVNKFKVFF